MNRFALKEKRAERFNWAKQGENTMRKIKNNLKKIRLFTIAALVSAAPVLSQSIPDFLKGKVHIIDSSGQKIERSMESACKSFKDAYKDGDSYFTGYIFPSRYAIQMGGKWEHSEPYSVIRRGDKIKVSRLSANKNNIFSTSSAKDEGGPAGLLFLNRMEGNKTSVIDVHIFDLDQNFHFENEPLFWLGEKDSQESVNFLKDIFEGSGKDLGKDLVFVLYSHDNGSIPEFLRDVSLGRYENEVRESAIFWLGNIKDKGSLNYLKEIYNKSGDYKIKKKVIFSIQLSDSEESVEELIKIAKNEDSREVRKSAIFWLGQKASEKSISALKDVVEGSKEDDEVKKSAVFALSQLPKDQAILALIEIANTNKSAAVRKNAIFWLGQTGDERALQFFEDILLKK
jgi:HEAT repeat protein